MAGHKLKLITKSPKNIFSFLKLSYESYNDIAYYFNILIYTLI